MLTKIMVGGLIGSIAALGIVFSMLMNAKEANGALVAQVDEVAAVNNRQVQAIDFLKLQNGKLVDQVEKERNTALKANKALLASEKDRATAENDFQARLRAAKAELTYEELVCSTEPVPRAFIDSLRE